MMNRRQWMKTVVGGAAAAAAAPLLVSCRQRRHDYATELTAEPATERFSPTEQAEIVAALPGTTGCVGCARCMPCRFGVNIPGVLRAWDADVDNGLLPPHPAALESREGLDSLIDRLHALEDEVGDKSLAHRCIMCGKCLSQCPMEIDIPSNLHAIGRFITLLREKECATV